RRLDHHAGHDRFAKGVRMKILVPVKRVPDPTQKAKIKDGHIDLTGASWIVNTFDEYAVETALRLLENGDTNTRTGGEIVVVSIGPEDAAKEIRTCLAIGADRAIHVVATDADGVTPDSFSYSGEGARLPSLKGIMAAKKKPMTTAKLADYGVEPQPKIKEVSVTLPPPRAAGQIVADIPTLVKKLAEEAKVL